MAWDTDPGKKLRVGLIEQWKIHYKGSRNSHISEWDDLWHLYDARGIKMIGFITNDGTVFKFDKEGQPIRFGEWKILHTGLKMFYGLSIRSNVDFDQIDPYGDVNPYGTLKYKSIDD